MAANTSKGITYPTSGDSIAPLETVFATMASTTNTALSNINASTDLASGTVPINRGGTNASTASAALTNLGALASTDYINNSKFSGKNAIINGAFDIWQRAVTSTSTTVSGYWADRWRYLATNGTSKVFSQSQQVFTVGSAPVAGYEGTYFLRVAVTTAGSGYASETIEQPIEDVRTFAGNTVTVSFWAKVASGTLSVTPRFTQNFGTGGTPSSAVVTSGTAISVGTTWQRYTQTISIPSISGKTIGTSLNTSSLIFALSLPTNTLYTIDLWGVQVELGSTATVFSRAGGNFEGELALAQRYYYLMNNTATATSYFATGMQFSSTTAYAYIKFPQQMRAVPSALDTAGTINVVSTSGVNSTATTFASANLDGAYIQCSAAGTAGQGVMIRFTGTAATAYVGFSAEY